MNHRFGDAIIGGFGGTVALTGILYIILSFLLGEPRDLAGMVAEFFGVSWSTGMIFHFITGTLVLPILYVEVARPMTPGSETMRGMVFGVVVWLLAQIMIMPLLEAGVFSMQAGGFPVLIGSLIAHLFYGFILGATAGTSHERQPSWKDHLGPLPHARH